MKRIEKIKSWFLLVITLSYWGSLFAQDTIIRLDGTKIPVKIIEISNVDVKYKKASFLDGPTYIEKKTDIEQIKYLNNGKNDHNVTIPIIIQTIDKNDTSQTVLIKDIVQPEVKKNVQQPIVKIETDDYYGKPETIGNKAGALSITKKSFKKNDVFITEQEFYTILKQTNDKEITAFVEKAMKAKKRQYISFGCIIGGSSFFVFPPAFFLLEPIPFITYFTYRASRKSSNKKAVELYNKRY